MTKATLEFWKFVSDANASFLLTSDLSIRYGQHLVNELSRIRPDIERKVPLDVDCYYANSKVAEWLGVVGEMWESTEVDNG